MLQRWQKRIRHLLECSSPAPRVRQTESGSPDDEAVPVCGWYESSWELQRGLAVVEGPTLEQAVWELVQGDEPPRLALAA